jgi:hypothetical protein
MITIHFLIFEQELILVLLLTFGLKTLNENNLLCLLLGILFIDLLFESKACIDFMIFIYNSIRQSSFEDYSLFFLFPIDSFSFFNLLIRTFPLSY